MFNEAKHTIFPAKPEGAKDIRESAILKVHEIKRMLADERGSMGIKEIAITVAVIVIIAAVTTAVTAKSDSWVTQIWNMLVLQIQGLMGP